MDINQRKRRVPDRFEQAAKAVVAETVKKKPKAKKPASKSKAKTPAAVLIEPEVIEQSPPPTAQSQTIDRPIELLANTISTIVLWKGKEVRARSATSKRFDVHDFNTAAIQAVKEKANKKGYRVVLQSAIAALSKSGGIKSMDSQCRDMTE